MSQSVSFNAAPFGVARWAVPNLVLFHRRPQVINATSTSSSLFPQPQLPAMSILPEARVSALTSPLTIYVPKNESTSKEEALFGAGPTVSKQKESQDVVASLVDVDAKIRERLADEPAGDRNITVEIKTGTGM